MIRRGCSYSSTIARPHLYSASDSFDLGTCTLLESVDLGIVFVIVMLCFRFPLPSPPHVVVVRRSPSHVFVLFRVYRVHCTSFFDLFEDRFEDRIFVLLRTHLTSVRVRYWSQLTWALSLVLSLVLLCFRFPLPSPPHVVRSRSHIFIGFGVNLFDLWLMTYDLFWAPQQKLLLQGVDIISSMIMLALTELLSWKPQGWCKKRGSTLWYWLSTSSYGKRILPRIQKLLTDISDFLWIL